MAVPQSFQTARLEAERIAPAHLPDLRVLHRDREVMAELGGVRSDAETSRYLERNLSHWETHGFGVWMLRPRDGQSWIGRVVLRWLSAGSIDDVEIGFAFLPAYWGRGLATEAGEFCLGLAQAELALGTLVGITTPGNLASRRVLGKLGLRFESEVVVEQTRCLLHRVRW